MLMATIAIIIGFVVLVWSADRFVAGAAALAHHLGMSAMMIGMTVVALGTSAPEIFASATAALSNASELAIGNALGSNIANIGLVLGITCLVSPLPIRAAIFKKEVPMLIVITLLSGLCFIDGYFGIWDGLFLITALVIVLWLMIREKHVHPEEDLGFGDEDTVIPEYTTKQALAWVSVGLIALMASAKSLVWGATEIAQAFGVSDLVIGLTIVAIGTSLPELAASITSARKGHHDIAIGNIIGSNLFNLLAVMSLPGLINPTEVESVVLYRDFSTMTLLTFMLVGFAWIMRKQGKIARSEGTALLFTYAAYLGLLYYQSIN